MAGNARIRIRDGAVPGREGAAFSSLVAGSHGPDAAHVQAAQLQQLARLKQALEQSDDAVYITDSTGTIEYVNRAFEVLTGSSRVETVGRQPADCLDGDVSGLQAWFGMPLQAGKIFSAGIVQRRKPGETFQAEINVRPFVDMLGRITHFVATVRDVSARIKAMRSLEHLAYHDDLTGLPNRGLFRDRVQRILVHSARHREGFALNNRNIHSRMPG
ncbi:MAG: PAS domain S-box protein [Methylococcaceae bacterium]|nr:PAS domain S-box protein [Methylococcaceae bacterium]